MHPVPSNAVERTVGKNTAKRAEEQQQGSKIKGEACKGQRK